MQISLHQRALSYLYPVTLERKKDFLEKEHWLQLYRNQLMLCTPTAIYSYGTRYYPFAKPFEFLKSELMQVHRFLMLGTALGSGLKILQDQYACYPESTLVDINETLLNWSKEYMDLNKRNNVQWICSEASFFVEHCNETYDLIGLDIFIDMSVPHFVKSEAFLRQIKQLLNPEGYLIFNLMFNSQNEHLIMVERLHAVFNSAFEIPHDRNTFYICRP